MKRNFFLFILLLLPVLFFAQSLIPIANYLRIDATAKDPLYTNYAATISRKMISDGMVYKMDYYSDSCLLSYSCNGTGTMSSFWKIDDVVVQKTGDYYEKPIVIYSFPDMVILEYKPVMGIQVRESFFVYNSSLSMVDMEIRNTDVQPHEVSIFPVLNFGRDSVQVVGYNREYSGILAIRTVLHNRLKNDQGIETSRTGRITEFFTAGPRILSYEYGHGSAVDFGKSLLTGSSHEELPDSQNLQSNPFANFLVLHQKKLIRPGETIPFRYIRGTQIQQEDSGSLMKEGVYLKTCFLRTFFEDNLMLFLNIPKIRFDNPSDKLVYFSALNLARNSIYPASGKSRFNYYSSSGNPLPDANQGQQLFQDASGLIGYAYLDPGSAKNSFRIFIEQLDRNEPLNIHDGNIDSNNDFLNSRSDKSLLFFNWIGMEIYKVSRDMQFLKETYVAGKKHLDCLLKEDLSEKEKNPELTLLIIKEERCLAWMAKELGKTSEAAELSKKSLTTVNKDSKVNTKSYEQLLRNYLVYVDLKNSGNYDITRQLATKMKSCVSTQLSNNHDFWELYHLDVNTASGITNYFPDAIIAKLLIEENVK